VDRGADPRCSNMAIQAHEVQLHDEPVDQKHVGSVRFEEGNANEESAPEYKLPCDKRSARGSEGARRTLQLTDLACSRVTCPATDHSGASMLELKEEEGGGRRNCFILPGVSVRFLDQSRREGVREENETFDAARSARRTFDRRYERSCRNSSSRRSYRRTGYASINDRLFTGEIAPMLQGEVAFSRSMAGFPDGYRLRCARLLQPHSNHLQSNPHQRKRPPLPFFLLDDIHRRAIRDAETARLRELDLRRREGINIEALIDRGRGEESWGEEREA
jgi:hypothetical protein